MRKLIYWRVVILGLGLLAIHSTTMAQQGSGLTILRKHPINSAGGWDYVTVDATDRKLYVSHGTQVNILNISTGDSVGVVTNTNGVHGIALVKHLGKGYTSNGKSNSCSVFDLKTYQTKATIAVGNNPDAILYDDPSKKVYIFNGKSNDASVIDPVTDLVIATIPLSGKPETGVSNGKGKIYVNIETTNEVVEINTSTYKVVQRFKIYEGVEPSGLAIDLKYNRLFTGCGGNQTLVVLDASTGRNLAKLPIGNCDGVVFDPLLKTIYTSNRNGTLSVIRQVSADRYDLVENVATEVGARTIGIDLTTHHLFLPVAQTKPVPRTATDPNPRPVPVAGTFHVLEIGK